MSQMAGEFLRGVVGGFLAVPVYLAVYPVALMLAARASRNGRYGVLSTAIGVVAFVVLLVAPYLMATVIIDAMGVRGMPRVPYFTIDGVSWLDADVYLFGALPGGAAAFGLTQLPVFSGLKQAWLAWTAQWERKAS